MILWDTYSHDPEGWFVQVMADVDDAYDGGLDDDTNWYTPNYTTAQRNIEDVETPKTWTSGPVELTNHTRNSTGSL